MDGLLRINYNPGGTTTIIQEPAPTAVPSVITRPRPSLIMGAPEMAMARISDEPLVQRSAQGILPEEAEAERIRTLYEERFGAPIPIPELPQLPYEILPLQDALRQYYPNHEVIASMSEEAQRYRYDPNSQYFINREAKIAMTEDQFLSTYTRPVERIREQPEIALMDGHIVTEAVPGQYTLFLSYPNTQGQRSSLQLAVPQSITFEALRQQIQQHVGQQGTGIADERILAGNFYMRIMNPRLYVFEEQQSVLESDHVQITRESTTTVEDAAAIFDGDRATGTQRNSYVYPVELVPLRRGVRRLAAERIEPLSRETTQELLEARLAQEGILYDKQTDTWRYESEDVVRQIVIETLGARALEQIITELMRQLVAQELGTTVQEVDRMIEERDRLEEVIGGETAEGMAPGRRRRRITRQRREQPEILRRFDARLAEIQEMTGLSQLQDPTQMDLYNVFIELQRLRHPQLDELAIQRQSALQWPQIERQMDQVLLQRTVGDESRFAGDTVQQLAAFQNYVNNMVQRRIRNLDRHVTTVRRDLVMRNIIDQRLDREERLRGYLFRQGHEAPPITTTATVAAVATTTITPAVPQRARREKTQEQREAEQRARILINTLLDALYESFYGSGQMSRTDQVRIAESLVSILARQPNTFESGVNYAFLFQRMLQEQLHRQYDLLFDTFMMQEIEEETVRLSNIMASLVNPEENTLVQQVRQRIQLMRQVVEWDRRARAIDEQQQQQQPLMAEPLSEFERRTLGEFRDRWREQKRIARQRVHIMNIVDRMVDEMRESDQAITRTRYLVPIFDEAFNIVGYTVGALRPGFVDQQTAFEITCHPLPVEEEEEEALAISEGEEEGIYRVESEARQRARRERREKQRIRSIRCDICGRLRYLKPGMDAQQVMERERFEVQLAATGQAREVYDFGYRVLMPNGDTGLVPLDAVHVELKQGRGSYMGRLRVDPNNADQALIETSPTTGQTITVPRDDILLFRRIERVIESPQQNPNQRILLLEGNAVFENPVIGYYVIPSAADVIQVPLPTTIIQPLLSLGPLPPTAQQVTMVHAFRTLSLQFEDVASYRPIRWKCGDPSQDIDPDNVDLVRAFDELQSHRAALRTLLENPRLPRETMARLVQQIDTLEQRMHNEAQEDPDEVQARHRRCYYTETDVPPEYQQVLEMSDRIADELEALSEFVAQEAEQALEGEEDMEDVMGAVSVIEQEDGDLRMANEDALALQRALQSAAPHNVITEEVRTLVEETHDEDEDMIDRMEIQYDANSEVLRDLQQQLTTAEQQIVQAQQQFVQTLNGVNPRHGASLQSTLQRLQDDLRQQRITAEEADRQTQEAYRRFGTMIRRQDLLDRIQAARAQTTSLQAQIEAVQANVNALYEKMRQFTQQYRQGARQAASQQLDWTTLMQQMMSTPEFQYGANYARVIQAIIRDQNRRGNMTLSLQRTRSYENTVSSLLSQLDRKKRIFARLYRGYYILRDNITPQTAPIILQRIQDSFGGRVNQSYRQAQQAIERILAERQQEQAIQEQLTRSVQPLPQQPPQPVALPISTMTTASALESVMEPAARRPRLTYAPTAQIDAMLQYAQEAYQRRLQAADVVQVSSAYPPTIPLSRDDVDMIVRQVPNATGQQDILNAHVDQFITQYRAVQALSDEPLDRLLSNLILSELLRVAPYGLSQYNVQHVLQGIQSAIAE